MNLPGAGIAAAAISMRWSDGVAVRRQMVAIRRPGVYPRSLFSNYLVKVKKNSNKFRKKHTYVCVSSPTAAAAAVVAVTAAVAASSIRWGGGVAVRRQMAIRRPGV